MQFVLMVYYALICGVLSMVAPQVNHRGVRFLLGVAFGLAAAALSPYLRALVGQS